MNKRESIIGMIAFSCALGLLMCVALGGMNLFGLLSIGWRELAFPFFILLSLLFFSLFLIFISRNRQD